MRALYTNCLVVVLIIAGLCMPSVLLSQSIPKGISYQGIARTDAGVPISKKPIVVEMTVLSDSETGTIVWQEIHNITTDENGFFSLVVGEGLSTMSGSAASFSSIDWGKKELFLKTRVDFGVKDFGNGMVSMGVIKLLSVPYALLADSALKAPVSTVAMANITDVDLTGLAVNQVLKWNGTDWVPGDAISGTYLSADGTTDLTGNWNISSRNITLTNGTLTAKTSVATNLVSTLFKLQIGAEVSEISVDATLGGAAASDTRLVTQKAIKTYIDNNMPTGGYWTLNNNDVFNTTNNIGIGTNAPLEKLHADLADRGVLFTGIWDGGNIPSLNGGSKMFFYPRKAAFRAGRLELVNSDLWNDINVGNYSAAFGKDTKASGLFSVALGNGTSATGTSAFTMGTTTTATNDNASAFGLNTTASGKYSMAIGNGTKATGEGGFAVGGTNGLVPAVYSTAGGKNSFAAGSGNLALGDGSFSTGRSCESSGQYSMALGELSSAKSAYSVALGYNSKTEIGIASFAVGSNTYAKGNYSVALGNTTKANSQSSLAAGNLCVTNQMGSFAMGESCTANGVYSSAIGANVTSQSYAEFVIGQYNKIYNSGLGVGQWDSSNKLFVIGNGTSTTLRSDAFIVWKDAKVSIGTDLKGGAADELLYVAGKVLSNGTALTSDSRYKKEVKPISDALNRTLKLNGVYYKWETEKFADRNFSKDQQIGFIAQEVEKLFPELVSTGADGYKAVDYSKLTPILVEAIKEQQALINQLQKENTNKDQEIGVLKAEFDKMSSRIEQIEKLIQGQNYSEKK